MQAGNGNNREQEITLKITVDEANLILEGLGMIPFARVYSLVNKLQEQASQQLNTSSSRVVPSNGAPTIEADPALSKA